MINYSENPDKQYHIQTGPGEIGKYVILPGDPKRCVKIARYLEDARQIADNREFITYTGMLDGEMVSVTSTGIGGPSAAIAMEELVRCGADTFVRVGTCGGMSLPVKSGDLIVANAAVRMEGTSREYAPIEYPAVADYEVTGALVQAAADLKLPCHVGVVQCKDSFYGQHSPETKPVAAQLQAKWNAWVRLGCKGSEMESAAIFIVAAALGVRAGTVLLVMASQARADAGLDNPIVHDTDAAVRTAIEGVRILIRQDREKQGTTGERVGESRKQPGNSEGKAV